MFQNIKEDTIEIKEKSIFSNLITKKNIVIYIISFMISLVGLNGDYSIFSISILGACFATEIPALGIIIFSLIGNVIKYGTGGALGYFLTSMAMIITLFIFKPKFNEQERNEKIKLGKNVFLSTFLIQIIKLAMSHFTIYDLLFTFTVSIIALVFYKIFVNSIVVLQDFNKSRAFSIEELIGASLLMAIAVSAFDGFSIYGFNLRNVLSILIVMILGWKNGILIGTTSGVTIGVTLGVITGSEPIMIAAYAISGMISGMLNRFGKIGVIVGFILGNIVLAYVSNGYTIELIYFKEILIASIGLLAIPKTFRLDLEEFVGKSQCLPVIPNRTLDNSKEMIENLNKVSEVIQDMATSYKQENNKTSQEIDSTHKDANKQIFIAELLNNLEPYRDNMLYDDITQVDGKIIDKIFTRLLDKQEIDRKALLEIFAECNSYIVGLEDNEISEYLETTINQMIRTINMSYKISKSDFIWRKRVEQNNNNMRKQLNHVSEAIQNLADDIEKGIKIEEKYSKEKLEILEILKQKGIQIEDISIKKEQRFIIEIYLNNVIETSKINAIEKILTQILKEKIVLNSDLSVGNKLNFLSDDKYVMAFGKAETVKNNSTVSGDSMLNIRLKDGKYLVAISDGMGSGKNAKESSNQCIRMLENLLQSGFEKEISLQLINSALINTNKEIFSTIDIAIIDLYVGTIELIKSGACPTYVKNKNKVKIIKSTSLPAGIMEDTDIQTFDKDICSGDIIIMCTDGILDSNVEYKNKELWLKYMLEDIETNNTQKIADLILNESIDNNYGIPKDDMSIMVCKFMKKED